MKYTQQQRARSKSHEHDRKTHVLQNALQDINEHAVEVALFEKHEAKDQSPLPKAKVQEHGSGPQAAHKCYEQLSRAHVMQQAHREGLI